MTTQLDPRTFIAGLSEEDRIALMASFFAEAPEAVTAHLQGSASAQALVKTIVKPERTSSRGPSFLDLLFADEGVLAAMANQLGLADTSSEAVWGAIQARLEKASITGTFERRDAAGVVHKMRCVIMDETAKTKSAIQKKVTAVSEASDAKALTTAVEAALASLKKARALPETEKVALTEAINGAKTAREATFASAEAPPPPPPA